MPEPDAPPVTPSVLPAAGEAGGPLAPIREGQRILAIDALRGFALFGILLVNMLFFAMPLMEAVGVVTPPDLPLSERISWALVKGLGEFKFVSIFSLLFGIGFVVQSERAKAKEGRFLPVYLRRLFVLGLIGLGHAMLLWYGDILLFYAVIGLVLVITRNLTARTLAIVAGVMLAVSIVLGFGCGSMGVFGAHMQEQSEVQAAEAEAGEGPVEALEIAPEEQVALRGWAAMKAARFDPAQEEWRAGETAAYREGPFTDAITFRAVSYASMVVYSLFGFWWRVAGMFLLGAALMKAGFFNVSRAAWQRRALWLGLGIGLPLEAIATAVIVSRPPGPEMIKVFAEFLHAVGSLALAFGYVGVVTRMAFGGRPRWLLGGLASAGRLALTVYLMETVIATAVMYWWGLGRFGEVDRSVLIGLTFVVYAALVVLSVLWLKPFVMGPVEWLWRAASYGHLPAMRRRARP